MCSASSRWCWWRRPAPRLRRAAANGPPSPSFRHGCGPDFFRRARLGAGRVCAGWLCKLLQPLRIFHPEWIDGLIDKLTSVLSRFREEPGALAACFTGAIFVQATTVVFYVAVARALGIAIGPWDLAVIVPLSFVVQMLPVSINGFGVREATFSLSFSRLGLPIESALLVSLVPTVLVMLFSLLGAGAYILRRAQA